MLGKNKHKGNVHDKTRALTDRKRQAAHSNCIKNKEGTILMEEEEINKEWKEYITDHREDKRDTKSVIKNETEGLEILLEEIVAELKQKGSMVRQHS